MSEYRCQKSFENDQSTFGQHSVNVFIYTYDTSKFREFPHISDAWKDVLKYMLSSVKIISQIDSTSFPHVFYTGGTSMEVEVTRPSVIRSWQGKRSGLKAQDDLLLSFLIRYWPATVTSLTMSYVSQWGYCSRSVTNQERKQ